MTNRIAFDLSERLAEAMSRLGRATGRNRDQIARDWVIERATALALGDVGTPKAALPITRREDPATGNEGLRARHRPEDVEVLLVGESAPAGGTFFYSADSNLFHATREAFERALGTMPAGSNFLGTFADMGFWLYDMVAEPVNHRPGRPRKHAVSEGVSKLAELVADIEPDYIIGIKTSLEGPIKRAAMIAEFPASRIRILPFPLYQWREEYVREFAKFLTGEKAGRAPHDTASASNSQLTLHDAMAVVLRDLGGGPAPARQIANELATRRLYSRQDGSRADYQQLLLRARKYPHTFVISAQGIALLD